MATPSITVRARRCSAGLRNALVRVQREISASDQNGRLKYLRDFNEAFQSYESVLTAGQVDARLLAADVVLVGDYHALPASQAGAAEVLRRLAAAGRRVVLGVETIFARDQRIVDEWMRGEIGEQELRDRIRYDAGWGYEWAPFWNLLRAARELGAQVYGVDCAPRDDMRKIGARDRHAAHKICELRERHPEATVVVLFGESHLAPNHLPACLRARAPQLKQLTVLQNIDALFWRAASEMKKVQSVEVSDDVVCIFNATPLEKYESYRLCIERWRQERTSPPDLAPTVYNLIDALVEFLNIDKYSPTNSTQPVFLGDRYPEVYNRTGEEQVRRLLRRKGATAREVESVLRRLQAQGSCYVPRLNAFFVSRLEMTWAAEEAARFLRAACSHRVVALGSAPTAEDLFYTRVVEDALAIFGSLVLSPGRPTMREPELYAMHAESEAQDPEYLAMVDVLVLHKDFEAHQRRYLSMPQQIRTAYEWTGAAREFVVEKLASMLAAELYEGYLSGRIGKRYLRGCFLRRLDAAGSAQAAYFDMVRRCG